jgi:WD40 repeat protein
MTIPPRAPLQICSRSCVRELSGGHVSRSHACGIAISPDALYVAASSEDRSVAVYDLRGGKGEVAARLRCATDAVTAVAWHPALAHVAAGSLDGGVRFFR